MFSDKYSSLDINVREIMDMVQKPSKERIKNILEKSKSEELELLEVAELLEIDNDNELFEKVRKFTLQNFKNIEGNELLNISPIYLSSYCVDTCSYCQFSANRNNTQRTRLSLTQLEAEVRSVIDEGNLVIEFTLASDPKFTIERLVEYIAKTNELLDRRKGSGILLCSDYISETAYYKLKEAGLWGIVQWDETLDKKQYQKWHGKSPRKRFFDERVDNHDRAMKAGLQVATGILFGVADFRYDVLMQIAKARYLQQEYGKKPFVFGTPRLKPIGGLQIHPKTEVNDREFELALMVYKIAEPTVARWLQTRETPQLNFRNMLNRDVYTYRCGDVKPGGYSVNTATVDSCKGGQFGVNEMTREQFEQALRKRNFQVDYAWIKYR